MKHLSVSEAKAKFSEMLDQVEHGETIAITRHGKVIAHIAPNADAKWLRARKAMEGIMELRKYTKPVTVEEIIAWKNEGRE